MSVFKTNYLLNRGFTFIFERILFPNKQFLYVRQSVEGHLKNYLIIFLPYLGKYVSFDEL